MVAKEFKAVQQRGGVERNARAQNQIEGRAVGALQRHRTGEKEKGRKLGRPSGCASWNSNRALVGRKMGMKWVDMWRNVRNCVSADTEWSNVSDFTG